MTVDFKPHHIETYFGSWSPATRPVLGWQWGWQCFTCNSERDGFATEDEAKTAGAAHTERESA